MRIKSQASAHKFFDGVPLSFSGPATWRPIDENKGSQCMLCWKDQLLTIRPPFHYHSMWDEAIHYLAAGWDLERILETIICKECGVRWNASLMWKGEEHLDKSYCYRCFKKVFGRSPGTRRADGFYHYYDSEQGFGFSD